MTSNKQTKRRLSNAKLIQKSDYAIKPAKIATQAIPIQLFDLDILVEVESDVDLRAGRPVSRV